MANRYSSLLKFLENLNSYLIFKFERKKLSQLPNYNLVTGTVVKCLIEYFLDAVFMTPYFFLTCKYDQ
jgi:hypothetical protein